MIYKFLSKQGKHWLNELIKNPDVHYALDSIEKSLSQYTQLKDITKSKLVSKLNDVLKDALKDKEKLLDFSAEIKVALLFLDKGVPTEHEPYGKKNDGEKKKGPDLLVYINNEKVYIEVKRIRKTRDEKAQEVQLLKIEDAIRKIPSPFYVDISLGETLNPLILTDEVSNKIIKKNYKYHSLVRSDRGLFKF
jgi:hypothetical protein